MRRQNFQLPILKLAGEVEYDGEDDLWRLIVAGREDLAAALIKGSSLRPVLDTESQDEATVRNLIDQHFDRVEKYVATAEVHKWPDEMGVFPDWMLGKEPK